MNHSQFLIIYFNLSISNFLSHTEVLGYVYAPWARSSLNSSIHNNYLSMYVHAFVYVCTWNAFGCVLRKNAKQIFHFSQINKDKVIKAITHFFSAGYFTQFRCSCLLLQPLWMHIFFGWIIFGNKTFSFFGVRFSSKICSLFAYLLNLLNALIFSRFSYFLVCFVFGI